MFCFKRLSEINMEQRRVDEGVCERELERQVRYVGSIED